jgi:hypothetical protein
VIIVRLIWYLAIAACLKPALMGAMGRARGSNADNYKLDSKPENSGFAAGDAARISSAPDKKAAPTMG